VKRISGLGKTLAVTCDWSTFRRNTNPLRKSSYLIYIYVYMYMCVCVCL
jgi:hypothetical protein